jgi:hypothetical protein
MKSYLILFALFACTLSGCSQINTKIGWPSVYWEHGFLAVAGLLAVCFLIFFGFCGIYELQKEDDGGFIVGIIIWIVAALVLQMLPNTESGIQFVPLPPWYYASWTAWIISTACWLAIILGCLLGFSSTKADRDGTAIVFVIALALNGTLSFCSASNIPTEPTVENIATNELSRDKIAQWEEVKQQQSNLLQNFSYDREMLETRIKNLGVKTKRELIDHPIGGPLVEELEQLTHQIAKVQNKIVAIESVQSKLRSLEREKSLNNAGLLAEKMTEVSRKQKEQLLNASDDQTPDSAVQRDKLLDGLIARPEAGK